MKTMLKQYKNPPRSADFDGFDHLILLLPEEGFPDFPHAGTLRARLEKAQAHDPAATLTTDLPNARGTHVTAARLKKDITAFDLLTLARKLCARHLERHPAAVALYAAGLSYPLAARGIEALTAALLAGSHEMPAFKSKKTPAGPLRTLHIHGHPGKLDAQRLLAEAEGNNLARHLTALPANELTPGRYRARIAALAKEHGWEMQFLDLKTLKRKKAGAFLAVAQASVDEDDGIVFLRYEPKTGRSKLPLALAGKGICFDTGGANLKPAKHMYGMHKDMAGSAAALGTLLALTRLQVDFPIHCWLALAQNLIGPRSYKQNEVVTACDGTTIEIVHTDAEGRLVLADTLALACRERPGMIVDYATLTGSCIQALGTRMSGAWTNRAELLPEIIRAGTECGERVWPFPLEADYDKELESDIADVKQCAIGSEADHILAARFLNRFVDPQIPWLHLDLAAANHKGGLAHIPTDITGFGVRYTLHLILTRQVMETLKASAGGG